MDVTLLHTARAIPTGVSQSSRSVTLAGQPLLRRYYYILDGAKQVRGGQSVHCSITFGSHIVF